MSKLALYTIADSDTDAIIESVGKATRAGLCLAMNNAHRPLVIGKGG